MAATLGITSDWDLSAPTGGVIEEQSKEQSLDIKTLRNESGVTSRAVPSNHTTTTITIKGKGAFDLSSVAAATLTSGAAAVKAATNIQNQDDFPSYSATAVAHS